MAEQVNPTSHTQPTDKQVIRRPNYCLRPFRDPLGHFLQPRSPAATSSSSPVFSGKGYTCLPPLRHYNCCVRKGGRFSQIRPRCPPALSSSRRGLDI